MLVRRALTRQKLRRVAVCAPHGSSLRAQSTHTSSSSQVRRSTQRTQIYKPKFERNSQTHQGEASQCVSCGIALQKSDPTSIGYYNEPKKQLRASTYQSKRLQFLSAFSKLDEEGRQLLNSVTERSGVTDDLPVLSQQQQQDEEELICQRCHDALHHNVYNATEHQPLNLHKVLDSIPPKDTVVHVFSAYDFPLSLVGLKGRRNVTYVMNKVDLLCGFDTVVRKYTNYFERMVNRVTGSESRLHIVSAHTSWAVDELYDGLERMNHLVGFVNAGKTRLANRILNVHNSLSYPGSSNVKPVGSSHLPALTRENIEHVCGDKTIVDTPGFLDSNSLFPLIKEESLKSVLQGRKVLVNDLKKEHYESVKGNQCFTVGGLFFLKVPEDTIVQAKPVCHGKPWTFGSVEKAISTVKSPPDALQEKFVVKPEAMDDMVRYVIPPFHGAVDLLIKDIGYVQITPTGAKKNDGLFEVYAPRGVVLGVRETIEHFMTRYMKRSVTKKIKSGRERGHEKEVLKMKAKPVPDYKIFSRLYEVPMDCSDPYDEMRVQYARHLREYGSSYHKVGADDKRDETRNKHWIEKV